MTTTTQIVTSNEVTENELATRFRDKSDLAAFAELEQRYRYRVSSLVRQLTNSDVDDLSQNVWEKVSRYINTYDENYSFEFWLLAIVHKTVRDVNRFNNRQRRALQVKAFTDAEAEGVFGRIDDDSSLFARSNTNPWDMDPNALPPDEIAETNEHIAKVQQALATLSPENRKLLEEIYYSGQGTIALSKQYDATPQTIRNRREVALSDLSKALGRLGIGKEDFDD